MAKFEDLDERSQNLLLAELLRWLSGSEEARTIDHLATMRGQTAEETWGDICRALHIKPSSLPVRLPRERPRQ